VANHLEFFGLAIEPFESAAARPLVLETGPLRRAVAWIRTELAAGESVLCVRGASGIGKSSLASALPHVLEQPVALIPDPAVSWEEIEAAIIEQLEISASVLSREALLSVRGSRPEPPVIVVDRAESLSNERFERFETLQEPADGDGSPLVALVFLADEQRLTPRLRGLHFGYPLAPLQPREIQRYLEARMLNAGFEGGELFPPATCEAIYESTEGIARGVDLLCTTLLVEAVRCGADTIQPDLVARCCGDVDLPAWKQPDRPGPRQRSQTPDADRATAAEGDSLVDRDEAKTYEPEILEDPSSISSTDTQTPQESALSATALWRRIETHWRARSAWASYTALSAGAVLLAAIVVIGPNVLSIRARDSVAPTTPPEPLSATLSTAREPIWHTQFAAGSLEARSAVNPLEEAEGAEQPEFGAPIEAIEAVMRPEPNEAPVGVIAASESPEPAAQSDVQAALLLRLASAQGNAAAAYNLAVIIDRECAVPADPDQALRLYHSAAEQGNLDAQIALAGLYASGRLVREDASAAAHWYANAAAQGHPMSQFNLGVLYERGKGVEQDTGEAIRWYRAAAEQGHTGAQVVIAEFYDRGVDVPKDHLEAARWYRLAAKQGHTQAAFRFGLLLDEHRMDSGTDTAAHWYRVAATQGDARAQLRLGQLYAEGDRVARNPLHAVSWYLIAAEGGMVDAQHALADLLSRSPEEPEYLLRAHTWANLSAAAGNKEARDLRDDLERRMSARQIANAQGRARAWYDRRRAAAQAGSETPAKISAIESPTR